MRKILLGLSILLAGCISNIDDSEVVEDETQEDSDDSGDYDYGWNDGGGYWNPCPPIYLEVLDPEGNVHILVIPSLCVGWDPLDGYPKPDPPPEHDPFGFPYGGNPGDPND